MSINAIASALSRLDPNNDNHWTADGLPKVDTVRFLAGDQSVTREQIQQTDPTFSRATAVARLQTVVTEVAPEAAPEQPVVSEQPADTVALEPEVHNSSLPDIEGNEVIGENQTPVEEVPVLSNPSPTEDELTEMYSKLNAAMEQRDKLNIAIDTIRNQITHLEELRYRAQNNGKPENPIMDYLAARQAQQMQRAEQLAEATSLRRPSPLDASFRK